ncbi:MAG TPA: SUMF1/EgtB/PvdO family nonheme iron enzyme [Planctomycetota bacterium]|nr:SUMF1/EgtB/PvdO family nonheme iron enzyme [Planctomycetota bacterium]
MQLNSLRPHSLAALSLGSLLVSACAQSPKPADQVVAAGAAAKGQGGVIARPSAPAMDGLPLFLLPVPGGTVPMGLTVDQLVAAACQVISPTRPAFAAKTAPEQLIKAMQRSSSTLGQQRVTVEPYLLAKCPVTCAQYEPYIRMRREKKLPARAPFGWWRYGCVDDYNSKLADIKQQFPNDPLGPVLYWTRCGNDLPYKLQDEEGRSTANLPVVHVDYREANEFAAWLGMRLPNEAEWTRAARGDGTQVWPWGNPADPTSDVFTEDKLKDLKIHGSRDKVLKPVGTVPAGTGPYGHLDMFGQVWQLVADLGYGPQNGATVFDAEWKKFQKDKTGCMVLSHPEWKADKAIGKGGSYLSWQEPIQLLVDARAPVQPIDVLEGLGFRLAKSLKPGYDVLFSRLRGIYSRNYFVEDQLTDLAAQIGAERYELGADGFPTGYRAVSFAPVNWLAKDRALDLAKLLEKSQETPLVIGTLVTTANQLAPAAPAGLYTVLYRKEGMPRELTEAIKQACKDLAALKKAKARGGEEAAGSEDKGKGGKNQKEGWREVIARYGLTEKDLEAIEPGKEKELAFVRLDEVQVPTDRSYFLLYSGSEGKIVAFIHAPSQEPSSTGPVPSGLVLEASGKANTVAKFTFGVPLTKQNNKRFAQFQFQVTLEQEPPTAEKPWRLPTR